VTCVQGNVPEIISRDSVCVCMRACEDKFCEMTLIYIFSFTFTAFNFHRKVCSVNLVLFDLMLFFFGVSLF
jgi:hypothetical protein